MPTFICQDEYGSFSQFEAETAKDAIEKHICAMAQREGCDPQDLASFEIKAHEIGKTTKAMWKTSVVRSAELRILP